MEKRWWTWFGVRWFAAGALGAFLVGPVLDSVPAALVIGAILAFAVNIDVGLMLGRR